MSDERLDDDERVRQIMEQYVDDEFLASKLGLEDAMLQLCTTIRQEERRAALGRHAKVLCGFCEQGKPLEYMEVPDCFKHRLEGETPWHTCWANNVRMAERALEAAPNETREGESHGPTD